VRIESAILAEGVVADIRGAMTIVGFNQRVVGAPNLPFGFRQTLVLTLIEDPEPDGQADVSLGRDGLLTVRVLDPAGAVRFSASQLIPASGRRVLNVPAIANVALEIPISGETHGVYKVQVEWKSPSGDEESRDIPITVLSSGELGEIQAALAS
jgi:hypothetical protein